jgi:hypothetical protein
MEEVFTPSCWVGWRALAILLAGLAFLWERGISRRRRVCIAGLVSSAAPGNRACTPHITLLAAWRHGQSCGAGPCVWGRREGRAWRAASGRIGWVGGWGEGCVGGAVVVPQRPRLFNWCPWRWQLPHSVPVAALGPWAEHGEGRVSGRRMHVHKAKDGVDRARLVGGR